MASLLEQSGRGASIFSFFEKILVICGPSYYTGSMKKIYYVIPKLNIPVLLSAGLLLAASILRIVYYTGITASAGELWSQGVLPICAGLLLALTILLDGGDRLYRTAIPVLMGCAFFALNPLHVDPLYCIFRWCLCLGVGVLYYATIQHGLSKWIFGAVVACVLAYRAMMDLLVVLEASGSYGWFQLELTVLLAMAAILLALLAMKKRECEGWIPSWGDRNDGRRLRTLAPVWRVSPYIMITRNTSQNFLKDSMECSALDAYVRRKRQEGLRGFGTLHVVLAAYARCVAQYPGVNRFISGQRAYARQEIEISMNVKPEMTKESPDTVIKLYLTPTDTAEDVYRKLQEKVESIKAAPEDQTSFDLLTKVLDYIPGLLLKFVVFVLRSMDYFGWLPRALTRLSPFHGSLYITSMASLGIPPIYHHLYDFGNVPVFVSLGKKYRVNEVERSGAVVRRNYIDYTFVTDERICDGFYFASVLRFFRGILQDPERLDVPVAVVVPDVR